MPRVQPRLQLVRDYPAKEVLLVIRHLNDAVPFSIFVEKGFGLFNYKECVVVQDGVVPHALISGYRVAQCYRLCFLDVRTNWLVRVAVDNISVLSHFKINF